MIRMTADGVQYQHLMSFLDSSDAVRECHHVTGGDALMMKVMVPSIDHLEALIMKLLRYGVPTTSIVLSTPVERHTYALRKPRKQ
jgi:Lrp/AsnC family leucine-responsive transcriptional regulator